MMTSTIRLFLLTLALLMLSSCGSSPEPAATAVVAEREVAATPTAVVAVEAPTETAAPTEILAEPATPTPLSTDTAVPPTATSGATLAAPAIITPTLTGVTVTASAPAATVTGAPPAGTATIAPPAPVSGGVEQPPYAPSACSDKYPCNDDKAGWEARIRVPAGFQATYFARINGQPTRIITGPDGLLYVATMGGTIFTVDANGNIAPYVSGLSVPTGLAFQPGTSRLYVTSRVINQSIGGEAQVAVVEGGGVRQIIGGLPCCYTGYHAANDIAFGPDGFGYVSVGSRADHGEILEEGPNYGLQDELHPYEAAILRFSPDGSSVSVYARGFRNAYGIAWDANGQLFATDNGPDGEPGWHPYDLLHRVIPGREHGYPWYDCSVCFPAPPDVQIVPPIYRFIPHSSVTGITVYLANQFPGYHNSLFVALWSAFPGAQKIMRFGPGGSGAMNFATGFAAPIDTAVGPDGSLFVADWATGIIFRIRWTG
jgi:hypothetical protein